MVSLVYNVLEHEPLLLMRKVCSLKMVILINMLILSFEKRLNENKEKHADELKVQSSIPVDCNYRII